MIHKLFKTTQHYTGNHVITGSGDVAHCFSYVRARFTRDLPEGPLAVMCGHGERAMTGASLAARRGRTDVVVLDGGPDTWSSATGLRLETGQ